MFEKIELNKELSKSEYRDAKKMYESRIGHIQRKLKEENIPVIIVFEGWDAAGKGSLINRMILPMDPRGFLVHTIDEPKCDEVRRPHLQRFWTKIPKRGGIAVFDKSWYHRTFEERIYKKIDKKQLTDAYGEIRAFERQLNDDGYIIIKLFIHISKREQEKRFKKLEGNEATSWRVTKKDWHQNKNYDEYLKAVEETIRETDNEYAPWTIIEGTDRRFASAKMYWTVLKLLEERLALAEAQRLKVLSDNQENLYPMAEMNASILKSVDLTVSLEREDYKKIVKEKQKRISELGYEIYKRKIPVVLAYEGWDAGGKGGNIKRLTKRLDPRGYEVIPVAAPNAREIGHHYLWRFWNEMPKTGHIAIFDRSWYGRVLVERVEGLCSRDEWKRAYKEINEMEEHLANFGTVIRKFWLEIDKDEQLRRFEERQNNPLKSWKITADDWRNREKWDAYSEAVDEMLFRTSTSYAPWVIIESVDKYYARIKVLDEVIKAIEARL